MRDDWNRYERAAQIVAAAFGTSVICTEKNGRLRVDFNETVLATDQAVAANVIEDLIELVSEFPAGYLEALDPPVTKEKPQSD